MEPQSLFGTETGTIQRRKGNYNTFKNKKKLQDIQVEKEVRI